MMTTTSGRRWPIPRIRRLASQDLDAPTLRQGWGAGTGGLGTHGRDQWRLALPRTTPHRVHAGSEHGPGLAETLIS